MRILKNDKQIALRLPKELIKKIDEFGKMLELQYLPVKFGGYQSLAIRLCIEDTVNRYMGPKDDPDELVSPYCDEMSKIIPVLKNLRLMKKLDEMPEGKADNKEEINKIIKEFA